MNRPTTASYIFAAIAAITVWATLVLQFAISVPSFVQANRTVGGAVVQLMSYFTIQSNILVALAFTAVFIQQGKAFKNFFSRGSVLAAIALYITIVSMVYNLVLRAAWHPVGLFKLADELLHVLNPVIYIVYWLFFVPKQKLTNNRGFTWLLFPLGYLAYTLVRGALANLYPYPFMDVTQLGYQQVLINSFFMVIAFVVFGAIFLLINNWLSGKKTTAR